MDFLMLFVTLGTNDKSFVRLLDAVEACIKDGTIQEEVVVQAGYTKFSSSLMRVEASYPQDEFEALLKEARIIITHGGVGTIMTALKLHKPIIGVARLAKYQEHVNDHQIQLLESFEQEGYLIYVKDLEELGEAIKKAKDFTPAMYTSNTNALIAYIENWISSH